MSKGSRPINSSRRRGHRALTKKILIIGDGKSEEVYFNDWVGRNPNIKVISKGTGKTGIDEALRKAKGYERTLGLDLRAGDRIAIVMDLDLRYSSQDVADMVDLVSKCAYELYLSNPCFEVWLIDHFRKLTCYSTPEDLERTLREILQRGDVVHTTNPLGYVGMMPCYRSHWIMLRGVVSIQNALISGVWITIRAPWSICWSGL